jgi:hypothetical protein
MVTFFFESGIIQSLPESEFEATRNGKYVSKRFDDV